MAKRRRHTVTKCVVRRVKGGRFMKFCPHKRPRFVKGPKSRR